MNHKISRSPYKSSSTPTTNSQLVSRSKGDRVSRLQQSDCYFLTAEELEKAAQFGHNLANISIDSSYLQNPTIQAKDSTMGRDVFFKQGAYQPNNQGRQNLITHELTHVVQQRGSNNTSVQRKPKPPKRDLIEPTSDAIASGAGITGDIADANLLHKPDEYTGNDYMDRAGGASLNDDFQHFNTAEGANIGLGAANISSAVKEIKQGNKLSGAAKLTQGVSQSVHGGTKLTKGVAPSGETEFGAEIGSGIADLGGTIASFMSFVQNGRDKQEKQQQGGLTAAERRDTRFNEAMNLLGAAQSGVNTVKDVVNITGLPSEAAKDITVSGLAQGAAAIGIVVGLIKVIHGAIQTAEAKAKKGEIREFEKSIVNAIFKVKEDFRQQLKILQEDFSKSSSPELQEKLRQLSEAVKSLKDIYWKYAPTLDAMNRTQNHRMEQSGMKIVQGGLGIAGGSLVSSGFGAPIGIGVAAINGILSLGNIAIDWRRNVADDRLTTLASKIDRVGSPLSSSNKNLSNLSGKEKEDRIFKCYYRHLPEVMKGDKKIPGFKEDEFWDVKNFGWGDKKSRLSSNDVHIHKEFIPPKATESDKVLKRVTESDEIVKKNKWIELQIRDTDTLKISKHYKEKPKNIDKMKFKFSASARKSPVAMEASADIIAEALYKIGINSYKPDKESFETLRIIPDGSIQGSDTAQLEKQTSDSLLKIADITPQRWKAWLDSSNGEPETMKELIKKQVRTKN